MKKLLLASAMLYSLSFAGLASAQGHAMITDHAVGTPVMKSNLKAAGVFGSVVAVDNNSDYTITATVEGVSIVVPAHQGKQFNFTEFYRVLYVNIQYKYGSYIWNTNLQTQDDTALEVSLSSLFDGNPYFRVDPINL